MLIAILIDRPTASDEPAVIRAEVSSSRTLWLRFMRQMLTNRMDVICAPLADT